MTEILKVYKFTAKKFLEEDDSVTLSLGEIDLVENGLNEREASLEGEQATIRKSLIILIDSLKKFSADLEDSKEIKERLSEKVNSTVNFRGGRKGRI